VKDRESYQRQQMGGSMSRGGSRRGDHRRDEFSADGWNVAGGSTAPKPPAKAGDLTNFGKINKAPSLQTFGPSSVYAKKGDGKRDTPPPLSRTASSANKFSALGGSDAQVEPPATTSSSRAPSRKPSIDLGPGGSPEATTSGRKKIQLLPRSVPQEGAEVAEIDEGAEADEVAEDAEDVDSDEVAGVANESEPTMTDAQADARIEEDIKEFWNGPNIDEARHYFENLQTEHKQRLVSKLVSSALDKKENDVILVAELFSSVADGHFCSEDAFEQGLLLTVESVDDISVDVPKAYSYVARLLHGSKLPRATVESLASKIAVEGDPFVPPSQKLLKEYEKLNSD
jgi:translation initiation factor 4G